MKDLSSPIIGRGKSLLAQVLRMAQTRLELLSAEFEAERYAVTRELELAACAFLCLWLAGLAFVLWVVFALPPDKRSIVLAVLAGVMLATGIASWIALRRRARRPPLLTRVIQQLELDRASLHGQP